MTHNVQDFDLHAGDEETEAFETRDPQGAIVDVSGASVIRWRLSADAGTAALLSKALSVGIAITDGPNGLFEVTLDQADTEALTPALYYHEADMTLGGKNKIVVSGTIEVLPSTRP